MTTLPDEILELIVLHIRDSQYDAVCDWLDCIKNIASTLPKRNNLGKRDSCLSRGTIVGGLYLWFNPIMDKFIPETPLRTMLTFRATIARVSRLYTPLDVHRMFGGTIGRKYNKWIIKSSTIVWFDQLEEIASRALLDRLSAEWHDLYGTFVDRCKHIFIRQRDVFLTHPSMIFDDVTVGKMIDAVKCYPISQCGSEDPCYVCEFRDRITIATLSSLQCENEHWDAYSQYVQYCERNSMYTSSSISQILGRARRKRVVLCDAVGSISYGDPTYHKHIVEIKLADHSSRTTSTEAHLQKVLSTTDKMKQSRAFHKKLATVPQPKTNWTNNYSRAPTHKRKYK